MKDQNLDSMFENIDELFAPGLDLTERRAITIWVPMSYKERFDKLQTQTQKRFGKKIKEMLIKSIEIVDAA